MNRNPKIALMCAMLWTIAAILCSVTIACVEVTNNYQITNVYLQWMCAGIWWVNYFTRKRKG